MQVKTCKKRCVSLFAMLLMLLTMSTGVYAEAVSETTADGVAITMDTDKYDYVTGETVAVTYTVENQGENDIYDLTIETTLPDGLELAEGYSDTITIDTLEAGSSLTHTVEAVVTEEDVDDGDSNDVDGNDVGNGDSEVTTTGDVVTAGLFILAIGCGIGFFLLKGKKKAASGILMAALIIGAVAVNLIPAGNVEAATGTREVTLKKSISFNEDSAVIIGTISYRYSNDEITHTYVSVHDPSIVKDENTGRYYIFGSHLAWAYTDDLMNWYTFTNNINTDYVTLFATDAAWAANGGAQGNSSYNVSGNMWAPDIIYNEAMGKYCMYMSINGDSWFSGICLLTADSLDGDWTYVGTVIQSGNYSKATFDYAKVTGESTPDSRYQANRNGNLTYETNCIDPCVTYDEEGNLWMTYGSWFGGIWMIRLDESTGLRDYDTTYEYVENVTDPYQGYKIAGGFHSSGEASYIEHIGDYYYLFVTYGGLTADGGYNMRVYRSENITGPYVDESGDYASYSSYLNNTSSYVGNRLMSYYKWSYQTYGFAAQGHNSVLYDEDEDKIFLVYHTRTTDGSEGHYVKVHQMFLNEDGWLVTAPFEYAGETLSEDGYDTSEIAGSYEVLVHTSNIDYANLECVEPVYIELNEDGTVTGELTGIWTADGSYVTMALSGETYKGVIIKQYMEEYTDTVETTTFTVMGETNEIAVWGFRVDGELGLDLAVESISLPPQTIDGTDLTLITESYGTTITWASSDASVIAPDGTVTVPSKDTVVTLTATVANTSGSRTVTKEVTVLAESNVGADTEWVVIWSDENSYDLSSSVQGTYLFANYFNKEVGTAGLQIYNGVKLTFDVTRTGASTIFSNIISMNAGARGGLYFTGGSYLGYNATGGYFDANVDNAAWTAGTDYFTTDTAVTIDIVLSQAGYYVYADGALAYSMETVSAGTTPGKNSIDSMSSVLSYLSQTATDFNLGWGSWWDDNFKGTISDIVLSVAAINEVDTSSYEYYNGFDTGEMDWVSPNAQTYLTIRNDADAQGNYVQFAPGNQNSRCAYLELGTLDLEETYTVDLDVKLTAGNNHETQFAIATNTCTEYKSNNGISDNYILLLTTTNSTTWAVAGTSDTVTIAKDTWVHITASVDQTTGEVTITITNVSDDTVLYTGNSSLAGEGTEAAYIYVRGGRYNSVTAVDSISVLNTGDTISEGDSDDENTDNEDNETEEGTGDETDDATPESLIVVTKGVTAKEVTNNDLSGAWWDGATSTIDVPEGDFYLEWTWENSQDTYWYQDCVIELYNEEAQYFDMNFLCGGGAGWGDLLEATSHTTAWTLNGETISAAPAQNSGISYLGDYTVTMVRSGSTMYVVQTLKTTGGDVYQAADTFEGMTTSALTACLTGNPYFADNITCEIGTIVSAVEISSSGFSLTITEVGGTRAVEITNNDTSGDWWNGATSTIDVPEGDFYLEWTWENSLDPAWYQDCVIELYNAEAQYFDLNFLCGGGWGDLLEATSHTTAWTLNGETISAAPAQNSGISYLGDYTVTMVRSGSTMYVVQTLKTTGGDVYQAADTFEGMTTSALTACLTGNPYFADNITAIVSCNE